MLFSPNDAYNINAVEALLDVADLTSEEFAVKYGFVGMVCVGVEGSEDDEEVRVIGCVGVAKEALIGAQGWILSDILSDACAKYPAPHWHTMPEKAHSAMVKLNPRADISKAVLYVPLVVGGANCVVLCFCKEKLNVDLKELLLYLGNIASLYVFVYLYNNGVDKLAVLENYVKEVGHDIASSVQATIAKLNNIANDKYPKDAVKAKAAEAESEIMSTYRAAENLGIVVDPNYNIRNPSTFDLVEVARSVVRQFEGEARERHIDITLDARQLRVDVWGGRKSIESAIGQYLLNAIKYANGASTIIVTVEDSGSYVSVHVEDRGIPIDSEEKIWSLGVRGRLALDRHVNGSGIGLFTVAKIVKAHGGRVGCRSHPTDKKRVIFYFSIPKDMKIAKLKLLGV